MQSEDSKQFRDRSAQVSPVSSGLNVSLRMLQSLLPKTVDAFLKGRETAGAGRTSLREYIYRKSRIWTGCNLIQKRCRYVGKRDVGKLRATPQNTDDGNLTFPSTSVANHLCLAATSTMGHRTRKIPYFCVGETISTQRLYLLIRSTIYSGWNLKHSDQAHTKYFVPFLPSSAGSLAARQARRPHPPPAPRLQGAAPTPLSARWETGLQHVSPQCQHSCTSFNQAGRTWC